MEIGWPRKFKGGREWVPWMYGDFWQGLVSLHCSTKTFDVRKIILPLLYLCNQNMFFNKKKPDLKNYQKNTQITFVLQTNSCCYCGLNFWHNIRHDIFLFLTFQYWPELLTTIWIRTKLLNYILTINILVKKFPASMDP